MSPTIRKSLKKSTLAGQGRLLADCFIEDVAQRFRRLANESLLTDQLEGEPLPAQVILAT